MIRGLDRDTQLTPNCALAEDRHGDVHAEEGIQLFCLEEIGMIPDSAAERRQTVATAEGRGCRLAAYEPRSGDRIFCRSAAHPGLTQSPRPSAVATVWRRSAARTRSSRYPPHQAV